MLSDKPPANPALAKLGLPVLICVFLLLATLGVVLKSHYEPLHLADLLRMGGTPLEHGYLFGHDVPLPLSLRLSGAAIYFAIEKLLYGLTLFFMVGPETSALFPGTPWEHKAYSSHHFSTVISPFLAVHLYQVLLLVPLLLSAPLLFRSFWTRLAYLVAMMLCYGGWPPFLVNILFRLAEKIADWPKAYYMFADRLLPSDVSILSFMFVLVLILARQRTLSYYTVATLAVLGQTTAEHLGFVTGVAVFLTTLLENGPINRDVVWLATRRLAVAGVVSLALLLGIAALVISAYGLPAEWRGDGTLMGAFRAYSQYKWEKYGHYNFLWLNVIAANFLSFIALPIFIGGVLANLAFWLDRSETRTLRRQALAAGGVSFGFLLTMVLGLGNSGFASDMGRQALPLACLLLLATTKTVELGCAALRSRLSGRAPQDQTG